MGNDTLHAAEPVATTEEPFKIVGQLVAATKDEHGNIVGEYVAGQVVLYAAQFDQVRELVEQAWAAREPSVPS